MTIILLYYTSAVMCMNCTSYLHTLERAVNSANAANCCDIRVVDVTEDPPYQVRGITKIPSIIAVDQEGTEIDRKLGYQSVTKLVEWLQWIAQDQN